MDIVNTSVINALSSSTAQGRVSLRNSDFDISTAEKSPQAANASADTVNISKTAHALNEKEIKTTDTAKTPAQEKPEDPTKTEQNSKGGTPATQLSEDDLKQVQDLKKRDSEVRRHEAAHLAAAGKYATGGASYEYQRGPDGKSYAAGGEVGIDTSPISGDPQATLQKAQQIRAAAQAPANPSSQDRQVAASATQMESKARQEIAGLTLNSNSPTEQKEKAENGDGKDIKADNTKSVNTDSKNTTPVSNTSIKAASAYQAIEGFTKSQDDIASLIKLVA